MAIGCRAAKGLKYAPEGGCPFSIPTMTPAAANATTLAALQKLCPGLTAAEMALEKQKLVDAAVSDASLRP